MTATPRSGTTTRDRHRAVIRRGRPSCHICHEDIDYTLKSPDPGSFEVDHIIPLDLGGSDELDNKAASHRKCNRDKAAKTLEQLAQEAARTGPRIFVTAREW